MILYKVAASLIIFSLILALLIIGKDFLIPIVIAFGAWFLFNALAGFFGRIKIKNKIAPLWLRYIFSSILIGLFVYTVVLIISSNVTQLQSQMDFYEENFKRIEKTILNKLGIGDSSFLSNDILSRFNAETILKSVVESLSSLLTNTILVIIYLVFILLEQHMFGDKVKMILKQKGNPKISDSIQKIKYTVETYILLKTAISFATGLLSYLIMLAIGVDFALFWAFLIFLLNYIPNIGSLIATVFPALLALVQFQTYWQALLVFFGIGTVQFIIGNFIEPKIFGKSLNMSALVVVLSLTFWGFVWGIPGMFLCVPVTVTIMIILSNFEETKSIAILLSDDGNV